MGSKYATISEYTINKQIFTAQHLKQCAGHCLPIIGVNLTCRWQWMLQTVSANCPRDGRGTFRHDLRVPDRLLHLSALASRGNDGELLPPQAQPTARKVCVKGRPEGRFCRFYNLFTVNNLDFWHFHGMEEVIGSIPIRSTNKSTTCKAPPSQLGVIWCQKLRQAFHSRAPTLDHSAS